MKNVYWIFLMSWWLLGCASFGDRQQAYRQALQQHDWPQAQEQLSPVKPGHANYLLWLLESGTLAHYQGEWLLSNNWLQQAERDILAWLRLGPQEQAKAWLINPDQAPYRPGLPELVQLYQFRLLNSLQLANQGDQAALTAMRVDARRLDIALRQPYAGQLTALDDDSQGASLWAFLNPLGGVPQQTEQWQYQDDAFAQWLIGLVYERLQEWDNARVAYARAHQVCELRERVQFQRAPEVCQQYRLDQLRMLVRQGVAPSASELAALSAEQRQRLSADSSRLVVMQRQGLLAPKRELNFRLFAEPSSRTLVLEWLPTGDAETQQEQWLWFLAMYGDLNPVSLFWRASSQDPLSLLDILTSKRLPLGPLWPQAEQLGLIRALGPMGVRVAVPYVPISADLPLTPLALNGQISTPWRVQDPQLQWQQQALLQAKTQLLSALTREISRNLLLQQGIYVGVGQGPEQEILSLLGSLLTASLASTDTRMWLSLPRQLNLAVWDLPPGDYRLDSHPQAPAVTLGSQQVRLLLLTQLDTQ